MDQDKDIWIYDNKKEIDTIQFYLHYNYFVQFDIITIVT